MTVTTSPSPLRCVHVRLYTCAFVPTHNLQYFSRLHQVHEYQYNSRSHKSLTCFFFKTSKCPAVHTHDVAMSAAHSLIAVGTRVFRLPGFITSPITPITIIFIYESFVYCISYIMPIFLLLLLSCKHVFSYYTLQGMLI